MFRRKGRHSQGAHVAAQPASDLGAVTTLSSVAVGERASGELASSPAVQRPASTSPAPTPQHDPDASSSVLSTVPEAALVAVRNSALTLAPEAPLELVPPQPAIPPVEAGSDVTAVDSTAGSTTVIVPVAGAGRRARRLWPRVLTVVVVVVVGVCALAGIQLARPVPKPVVHSDVTLSAPVPGVAPTLPWPAVGERERAGVKVKG